MFDELFPIWDLPAAPQGKYWEGTYVYPNMVRVTLRVETSAVRTRQQKQGSDVVGVFETSRNKFIMQAEATRFLNSQS